MLETPGFQRLVDVLGSKLCEDNTHIWAFKSIVQNAWSRWNMNPTLTNVRQELIPASWVRPSDSTHFLVSGQFGKTCHASTTWRGITLTADTQSTGHKVCPQPWDTDRTGPTARRYTRALHLRFCAGLPSPSCSSIRPLVEQGKGRKEILVHRSKH